MAASQRPYRIQVSRAKRKLHGAGPRVGLLYYMQGFTAYLQFFGENYSAGQDRVIYFNTDDMWPTRGWKAIPAASQPTTVSFSTGNTTHGVNPLADSDCFSGVGPMPGIEP